MTSDYEIHVQEVLKQVPDADPVKVAEAFTRYEKDFLIPPVDAMRSVLRRFQSDKGIVQPSSKTGGGEQRSPLPVKKVTSLSELGSDDRNVEIEVEIESRNGSRMLTSIYVEPSVSCTTAKSGGVSTNECSNSGVAKVALPTSPTRMLSISSMLI